MIDRRWRHPGVWIFVGAVVLAASGWALVVREATQIPVRRAEVDGLHMELDQVRWILDQMDHGENFQKPSTMMPDMPEWGMQRVSLDLSYVNRSARPIAVDGGELVLEPELGDPVPPMGAQTGVATLAPGQRFHTSVFFDLDTRDPHGRLRVAWRRDRETFYFSVPEPPEHYHLRPRGGEVALPPDARLVEHLGDVERGAVLYAGTYGCIACHGDPATPGSNIIGPHLGTIAADAAGRVADTSASQYIYESILDPSAVIAPECRDGAPCQEPTAMPEYASLMRLEDAADLLVYLLAQDGSS